jgi:hypothetical protein
MHKIAPYLVWLFCAEDVIVSLAYLREGNWRWAGYWAAAALMMAVIPK